MKFCNPSISDGIAEFALPFIPSPTVSIFPDPKLSGAGTTTAQWTPAAEAGERIMQCTGVSGAPRLELWPMDVGGTIRAGDTLNWTADLYSDVNDGCDLTLIQYDSGGTEISRKQSNQTTLNAWQTVSAALLVAANAAQVVARLTCRAGPATVAKIRRARLTTTSQNLVINLGDQGASTAGGRTIIHLDASTGDDGNDGLIAAVKTFDRAMQLAGPDTLIIVGGGDYYGCPTFGQCQNLEFRAVRNAKVRLIGGTKIAGAELVDGTTKTYAAPMETQPPADTWLCVHDVPEVGTLISDADRLSIHEGRTYRLPFTRVWPLAAQADIESDARCGWYWEASTLYFSVPAGADPNAVYIPDATRSPFGGATGTQSGTAIGLQSYYFYRGFDGGNCVQFTAQNCRAFGARVNGFAPDNTRVCSYFRCEAGGNSNDGMGGHQTSPEVALENCHYLGWDLWTHDNWDDGESFHAGWTGIDWAGVTEFNGDRGVATAIGAHTKHYGMRARANGQGSGLVDTFDGGEGFTTVGPAQDGGVGENVECFNCISERNVINYRARASDGQLIAHNCVSIDPVNNHYLADSGSAMKLDGCTYSGTGTVKAGPVTVASYSAVT